MSASRCCTDEASHLDVHTKHQQILKTILRKLWRKRTCRGKKKKLTHLPSLNIHTLYEHVLVHFVCMCFHRNPTMSTNSSHVYLVLVTQTASCELRFATL